MTHEERVEAVSKAIADAIGWGMGGSWDNPEWEYDSMAIDRDDIRAAALAVIELLAPHDNAPTDSVDPHVTPETNEK